MRFQGKIALVTGGASGIGAATAKLFSGRGWRVGLADVDAAGLAATAALMPPDRTSTHNMDVRDRDTWVRELDRFTAPAAGALDVLFNNAGIPHGGPFATASFEEIDRVVAVNLVGAINGARIGYAYLHRAGGCLLNTASASAIYGSAGLAPYSATKFGVRALTEALDGEWHADGVRVRALVPGFIDTPLLRRTPEGSNRSIRETVQEAGLELTSADAVAQAAWAAVHSDRVLTYVGRTAHRLAFAARWMPGSLRKRMRRGFGAQEAE